MNVDHFLGLGMPVRKKRSRGRRLVVARLRGLRSARARAAALAVVRAWPGRSVRQAHRLRGRPLAAGGGASRFRRRSASPGRWSRACHGRALRRAHDDRSPRTMPARLTGWASYVQVVARRFARNFPGAELGVDLAIASDLPGPPASPAPAPWSSPSRPRSRGARSWRRGRNGAPRSAASRTSPGISAASRTDWTIAAWRAPPASALTAGAKITPPSWPAAWAASAGTASCRWRTRATSRCRPTGPS